MLLCKVFITDAFHKTSAVEEFNLWSMQNADCEITDVFPHISSQGDVSTIVVFYEYSEGGKWFG